jgi:hypothetical protein
MRNTLLTMTDFLLFLAAFRICLVSAVANRLREVELTGSKKEGE